MGFSMNGVPLFCVRDGFVLMHMLDTPSTLKGGVNSVYSFCYFFNNSNQQQLIQYYVDLLLSLYQQL